MTDALLPALDDREKYLVMAAYLENALPGTQLRANCQRILRTAIRLAGISTPEIEKQLGIGSEDEDEPTVVEEWYESLIDLAIEFSDEAALLVRGGYFGDSEHPAAHWCFTGVQLTERGVSLALNLLGGTTASMP